MLLLNSHPELKDGFHTPIAPSSYKADRPPEKILRNYISSFSTEIGTALHALAQRRINEHRKVTIDIIGDLITTALLDAKVPREVIDPSLYSGNLMNYINSCIDMGMLPEVKVKYTDNCAGTIDAFLYEENRRVLHIWDYKSGYSPINEEQTVNYAALVFLEYQNQWRMDIDKTQFDLRVYKTLITDPEGNSIPPTPGVIDIPADSARVRKQIASIIKDERIIRDAQEGKYVLR